MTALVRTFTGLADVRVGYVITADIYARASPRALRAAVERLDDVLGG
jgi:hypothetical protein